MALLDNSCNSGKLAAQAASRTVALNKKVGGSRPEAPQIKGSRATFRIPAAPNEGTSAIASPYFQDLHMLDLSFC
jgi:hypothetical protein